MNKGYELAKEKLLAYGRHRTAKAKAAYATNPSHCLQCGTEFSFEKRRNRFCNSSCSGTYSNSRRAPIRTCLVCGKRIRKNSTSCCSSSCVSKLASQHYIERWLRGEESGNAGESTVATHRFVRRWALERAQYKCEECGWDKINPTSGRSPLSVHHVDGNPYHTRPENLQVLCPNCHSLTPTYGSLNIGNGRKDRRKDKGR